MSDVRAVVSRAAGDTLKKPLNYIDGVRAAPSEPTHQFPVTEPATGKELLQCPSSGRNDVDAAVRSAREAFKVWSQLPGLERGRVLLKTAAKLRERSEDFARMVTIEQGKPLYEAAYEVVTVVDALEYYAGLASSMTGQHLQLAGGSFGIVRREPLGVCAGIGPWNFPLAMAGWKTAPALACGNTMVYKPSPFTPVTTVMLAELFVECGLPKGALNIVQGEGDTGRFLTSHDDIDKVSFTGSVPTGKKIMSDCAKGIKNVTLELGGKSPLIIFADANLDNALKAAMFGNFFAQGEICCNGTRVYIEGSIKDDFVQKLVAKVKAIKVGDPMAGDTRMGAVITKEHRDKILNFVEGAKKQGAKVLCGGEKFTPGDSAISNGYYVTPTILDQVGDDMTVAREEVFGPVMSIFSFTTEDEVIRRANDSTYGLAAGVFTNDLKKAHRMSAKLQAGYVWINTYNRMSMGLPFGGYKQSGIGRENSTATVDMFTQLKTVYVEMGDVQTPYI